MPRRSLACALLLAACAPAPATVDPEPATAAASDPAPADPQPAPAPEESVKPGINDAWKSDEVAPLVDRLESETREVFAHRVRIADVVAPKSGATVADVGSGSGFMTEELAKRVGADGKVYAVDINETLLGQVEARAKAAGLANVQTVLTPENGVDLAKASVDLMFICDTYHHFEFPKTILGTIHQAIKPGGELVIVDFERVEGESEAWILEHVRAGKETVTAEILQAGFELVREEELPELEQNYMLRFRRNEP